MRLTLFAMRFDANGFARIAHFLCQVAAPVHQLSLLVCFGLLVIGSGCANLSEKKTINAFQTGLESGNLEALRQNATDNFSSKALRHPQADDSLSQLKIPDGEFEVLKIEDVSETEKKVTLGFGKENKRKIMYRLLAQGKKKKWKVDDIYLRQRSGRKTIAMPVTEQMDVLLSSREFFESWTMGDRQRVLESSSPQLAAELEKLPPSVLAYNISLLIGKTERTKSFRPQVHINGDQAVVKLNRSHGTIQVSMKQTEAGWQVSDLALTGREKEGRVASLLERVKITNQAMAFLDAWQQSDKGKLKQITEEKFYTAGLAPSKLSNVPLPSAFEVEPKVDVKMSDKRADVILNNKKQTLQITLQEKDEATDEYIVADVILYNMENNQNLSLVSALTARPVAELFMIALSDRDQKMLRYNTTQDFFSKTWGRASKQTLAILPIPIKNISRSRLVNTTFQGEITHVLFETGDEQLTVVLHDQGGRILVDDVLIQPKKNANTKKSVLNVAQKLSLKNHLAAVAPVYELAAKIHNNQPEQTFRMVTDDFYGRVFSLTKTMPETAYTYLEHISANQPEVTFPASSPKENLGAKRRPSQDMVVAFDTSNNNETHVTFAGQNSSMQIKLVEEDGLLRISDAIVSNPSTDVAQYLKQSMRMELSQRQRENMIRTVSGEERMPPSMRKKSSPMQTASREKSLIFQAKKTSPQPNNTAAKPLKNALYEEYQSAKPPLEIEQAVYSQRNQSQQNQKRPLPIMSQKMPKRINPPREHQLGKDHLLLKPIPIQ